MLVITEVVYLLATRLGVVAAAERLAITEVATLDRRHFSVVQATNGPLNLLP